MHAIFSIHGYLVILKISFRDPVNPIELASDIVYLLLLLGSENTRLSCQHELDFLVTESVDFSSQDSLPGFLFCLIQIPSVKHRLNGIQQTPIRVHPVILNFEFMAGRGIKI